MIEPDGRFSLKRPQVLNMNMTPSEEKLITRLNRDLSQEITLGMRLTDDPRSNAIKEFCEQLTHLAPKIRFERRDDDTAAKLPSIGVGPRIDYCGVPSGNETAPFLAAVIALERGAVGVPPDILRRLAKIRPASAVTVFVAPTCRFCPDLIYRLVPLTLSTEGIRLTIIDASLFGDAADSNQVRSVPTVLVDGQYRWTGGVQLADICSAVESRDPGKLEKASLQRLISEGGAYDLAQMMLDYGRIFPSFIDLLVEENFTVRLAAMVTVEEMAAADMTAARTVIEPLWERYHQSRDTVKGDILYIFGELKAPLARAYLLSVIDAESNPEIKEAAREALEKIEKS
jgi:glutaredoxin